MNSKESEEHILHLIGGGDDETAIFRTSESNDGVCQLICTYRGRALEAAASDWFEALQKIRREMSKDGLIPFCYGASLNVWPSGMSRDMGGAWKAYKLTMGKPAQTRDLVVIFSEGPDVIPAHVDAQQKFATEWLASLKGLG